MRHYLRFLLNVYLILAVAAAVLWLALWRSGFSLYAVRTGSMEPVLRPGDLALAHKPQLNDLQIGDIITYRNSVGASITHRVFSIDYQTGSLIAKGDRLSYPDPPISISQVEAQTVKAIPDAGYALSFIHQPLGLILLVYLPALFICVWQLQRLSGFHAGRYRLQVS